MTMGSIVSFKKCHLVINYSFWTILIVNFSRFGCFRKLKSIFTSENWGSLVQNSNYSLFETEPLLMI